MAYTPQIYYPTNYQQQFQQIPQQNNNGLIWVSGEIGAKSYLVAPNTTIMLMDSEGDKFYIKTTDSSGMPTLRTFTYTECTQNNAQAPQSAQNDLRDEFVTRKEYDELREIIEDLRKPKTPRKKDVIDE